MGVLDQTYGAALDPQTMTLLSAAFSGLEASGPSRMPTSLGQVVGRAGNAGLNTYAGALNSNRQNAQAEALINLEKQKAALTGSQVEQAAYQQRLQQWALGGMQGPPPSPGGPPAGMPGMQPPGMQPPGIPQGMQPPGMPQSAPQPQPGMMPVGAPQAQPQPMGPQSMGPQPQPMGGPAGGPMQGVPDYLRNSAMMKTAGLPAIGEAIQKAGEPVVGREGGIYKRDAQGNLALDPGWLAGERQRMELQKGIEDQHAIIDMPLANGQNQKMTKAQQLSLVNGTAALKNAMPWASEDLTASFQRQMLASPGEDIPVNISVGGREPVKLVLPALNKGVGGMPGMTSGQSTEARYAQEASGREAGGVQSKIDEEAAGALQSKKILLEMRSLSQDFTQGKVAPFKRTLGEYAQALNLPGDWEKEIKGAESQQALQKLTAQMATAAMKQMTNRGTQMEFKTFLQNNPNAELTPGGFQKVLEFMDKSSQAALDKQQAYQNWRKTNPVEKSQDFLAEWNNKQSEALSASGSEKFPSVPQAAINRLKMKPSEKAQFDEIFGAGAADKVLGK